MSLCSSKLVSDVAGVNAAVQHMTDLGHRMKNNEFTFKQEDIRNIDAIIEALHELQLERAHVHDNLEVETIKASILRHELQALPGNIRAEITAAVASARESNAAELTRLHEKLRAINENIDYLEKRHRELEQENALLHPERDQVRKEHEDIIVQLNQRMAEKASKQIFLNETRDKLRTTNQKIVDLEDSIMQLKEDLVQERADARMEKRRLKKAVYDTTLKTREQKEANVAKKKEVDNLHQKVLESENELDNIRKTIRRFETSQSRMEGQERALIQQLNREKQNNQELKITGHDLRANWRNYKSLIECERAQEACVHALTIGISVVAHGRGERRRHRFKVWDKLLDIKSCTKNKVRDHITEFGPSGAEGGLMLKLTAAEEVCYRCFGKEWIIGIPGANEFGPFMDDCSISMGDHLKKQTAGHRENRKVLKEWQKVQQENVAARKLKYKAELVAQGVSIPDVGRAPSVTKTKYARQAVKGRFEIKLLEVTSRFSSASIHREEIARQTIIEDTEWQKKKIGLDATVSELDQEIANQEERNKEVSEHYAKLASELQGKNKLRKADEKRVRDTNKRLQVMKTELAEKAETVGELSQENIDMESKIEELAEQHMSIMATMNKQIDDARESLSKERKDSHKIRQLFNDSLSSYIPEVFTYEKHSPLDTQGKWDSGARAVDDVKSEANKFVVDMNRRIREGKDEHDKLTKEGMDLQKTIQEEEDNIKKLKEMLISEKAAYEKNTVDYDLEIVNLNEEITAMKHDLEEKKQLLEEKEPNFKLLESEFEEMNKEYDIVKKSIVAKKNQKLGLDDQVKRVKMQMDKMVNSRASQEAESKRCRAEILDQMRSQAADARDIEEKVYVVGCKLKTVLEENERFTQSNTKMEKDIANMHTDMESNFRLMESLKDQDRDLHVALAADWKEDSMMQEMFAAKDMVLVDSLSSLLLRTEERETIIANITEKLQTELGIFSTFLDNMATHKSTDDAKREKAAKARAQDPFAMVADANPAPPTPSILSSSPYPHLHPLIPPIQPTPNATPRDLNDQPKFSPKKNKLQPTPRSQNLK